MRLVRILARIIDREVKKKPELTALELCTALGTVAGICIGQNVPASSAEAYDPLLFDLMRAGFIEASRAVRFAKAAKSSN